MSYRALIYPEKGFAIEIEASSRRVEIKLARESAATVTTLSARELDALIASLNAARAIVADD